jgi:hypothetical protein
MGEVFMARQDLAVRHRVMVAQRLPEAYEEKGGHFPEMCPETE